MSELVLSFIAVATFVLGFFMGSASRIKTYKKFYLQGSEDTVTALRRLFQQRNDAYDAFMGNPDNSNNDEPKAYNVGFLNNSNKYN